MRKCSDQCEFKAQLYDFFFPPALLLFECVTLGRLSSLIKKMKIVPIKQYDLEKAMAPHSSTLARKIPWTEEPGRLQSMGSLRVGHD